MQTSRRVCGLFNIKSLTLRPTQLPFFIYLSN